MNDTAVDGAALRRFVERYAKLIDERKDELTELDAAIGDADHGTNMQRGMQAACERLPADGSPEAVLKAVAAALISKVGGASGPLYGTAFLRAGAAVAGKAALAPRDVEGLFRAAL
ncbi:MAG: DAK2 domain-containing protein, partial [Candidatus Baltobacteraceae bacterium]